MTLVWFFTIALASWFGFELGRKWDKGRREEIEAVDDDRRERGGIRLNRMVIRR